MHTRYNLNGTWRMRIGDRQVRNVTVPSSYRAVGTACLERELPVIPPAAGRRTLLCFDGVANTADIALDGLLIGGMRPFVPYAFDVTPQMAGTEPHTVRVTLTDINASFGYSPGWETYGGIIRDASILVADEAVISDVHVQTRLSPDFTDAELIVHVRTRNFTPDKLQCAIHCAVTLDEMAACVGDGLHASATLLPGGEGTCITLQATVRNVSLWSPDSPTLYHLSVSLEGGGNRKIDFQEVSIGFRDFRVEGRHFLLNGRPVFLKGVCRHDMWRGQGYTLSGGQMEQDMRAIKSLGANYIRLVHYPHHRAIIELAERLGIMVSEEPGLWNIHMLTNDPKTMERHKADSLDVMERIVRRDRNSPAVIAWLLGNECRDGDLGVDYLTGAARLCRTLDPGRPVSFSHIYTKDLTDAKKPYVEASLDFYDYHPYTPSADTFTEVMKAFNDKPLVFGEWGGWFVRNNAGLMKMFGDVFIRASHSGPADPLHLDGIAYWEWADMRQYGRGYPGCESGILTEGLVDEARVPKPDHAVMREIFAAFDDEPTAKRAHVPVLTTPAALAAYTPNGNLICVDLAPLVQMEEQRKAWEGINAASRYCLTGPLRLGAVPFRVSGEDGRPIVMGAGAHPTIIPIGKRVKRFHFLGHVSVEGYPVLGAFGETVARYIIDYEDGGSETIELRNALTIARQNAVFQSTRMEPVAVDAPVVLRNVRDEDFTHMEIRFFTHSCGKAGTAVKSLSLVADEGEAYKPLLYALTLETA